MSKKIKPRQQRRPSNYNQNELDYKPRQMRERKDRRQNNPRKQWENDNGF